MSVELIEVRTSRSFGTSATTATGTWLYSARVLSEANPETALIAAVEADAPFFWYNLARKEMRAEAVTDVLYTVEVEYAWEVPNWAMQDPTASPGPTGGPGGGPPSATPSGPAAADTPLGPDVSLEIGGRPPKLVRSLEVLVSQRAGGGNAPDNMGLLNVEDGKPEGLELPDPSDVLNIDRVVDYVTMGYIDLLRESRWKVNDDTFFHLPARSVMFMGANLQSGKDGRVKAAFKFGLMQGRSLAHDSLRGDTGKELPTVPLADPVVIAGWDYLEIDYGHEFDTPSGVRATRPSAFRVHRVLEEMDFTDFGIGT